MNKAIIRKELNYKAIRSSGAGGQHVNKVSSKVVLSFDITSSKGLSTREKTLLFKSIATRLTNQNVLLLSCDESRSQLQNKQKVILRLFELLESGLHVAKRRLPAKPSKNSIEKMKAKKNQRSEIKKLRKKPGID